MNHVEYRRMVVEAQTMVDEDKDKQKGQKCGNNGIT
jgi:hypothetical protein